MQYEDLTSVCFYTLDHYFEDIRHTYIPWDIRFQILAYYCTLNHGTQLMKGKGEITLVNVYVDLVVFTRIAGTS